MTKYSLCLFFLISFFFTSEIHAQQKCPDENMFETTGAGSSVDSIELKLPLDFIFNSDSVTAGPKGSSNNRLMNFKIVDKICDWDTSLFKGTITYKVVFFKKFGEQDKAVLIINYLNIAKPFIEIQYSNGRKRFFFIKPKTG